VEYGKHDATDDDCWKEDAVVVSALQALQQLT
jgi:hypothetical protein